MVRLQVADAGDDLQLQRAVANILNKQSRIAGKGWFSSLGVGLTTPHRKNKLVKNIQKGLGPRWIPWINDIK
jgi:hypothetical protein